MDLNLKDFISILDIIKKMSWGSLPLWLSIGVPIYYALLKKIIPDPDATTPVDNPTVLHKVRRALSVPKFKNWVIGLSVSLFIIGTITVIIEQKESEKTRYLGIRIKKYLIEKNYYSIPEKDLTFPLEIDTCDIQEVVRQYPNEFLAVYNIIDIFHGTKKVGTSKIKTILLTDSAIYNRILTKSRKILEGFLSKSFSDSISCITMNQLFATNNFFTYTTCNNLLSESSDKYSYAFQDGSFCICKNPGKK